MLNVAVVGLGWWGRIIAQQLRGHSQIRVAMAVDTDVEAARAFAAQQDLILIGEYEQALAASDIDAVILCTPHTLHARQIVAAARAGKHVFCEKPLALTRADAIEAVSAIEAAGRVLGIGHERRFEPPIQDLRTLYENGALGRLLQIEANFSQDKFLSMPAGNWRMSDAEAPAGPLTATGIHLLDLSVSFAGAAEHVFASVRQLDSELVNGDSLAILAQFKSGACALISAILATPFDGRFALYGSKGWAEVRDRSHPESPSGWSLTHVLRGQQRTTIDYPPAQSVLGNLEAFGAAIEGRAPYPVPHEQMIQTIALLEATVASTQSNRLERINNEDRNP